ncbi:MAG: hypothetical protein R3F48_13565 [Candidatus Zixiibacteriota bacterium]
MYSSDDSKHGMMSSNGSDEDSDIPETFNNTRLHFNLLNGLLFQAQRNKNSGEFKKAIGYYMSALKIDNNDGRIYRGLSHIVYDGLDVTKGQEITAKLEQLNTPPNMFNYYQGNIMYRRGLIYESIELLKISIAQNSENAYACNNLGLAYLVENDLYNAFPIIMRAKRIFNGHDDIKGLALVLCNLGLCERLKGNFEKSYRYFADSLEMTDTEYLLPERLNSICNLAELDLAHNKLIEAEWEFTSAANLAKSGYSIQQLIRSYIGLGDVLYKFGKLDESLEHLLTSLALAIINNDLFWVSESIRKMANYFYRNNSPSNTITYTTKVLKFYHENEINLTDIMTALLNNKIDIQEFINCKSSIKLKGIRLRKFAESIIGTLSHYAGLAGNKNVPRIENECNYVLGEEPTTYVGADNA